MPITTEHFMLEAFLDGDAYSALADRRRFSAIDNQLHAMTEVVGDGRIDGWEITPLTFPNIRITQGSGFIDGHYVVTFNDEDFELSANGTFNAYAQRRVGISGTVGPRSDVASITYNDAGAPAVPSGFSAITGASDSSFSTDLSWTANTEIDLDHYDIERSLTVSSGFSLVDTADQADTTYTDTTVDEDVEYFYRLYAVDQSGFRSTAATDSITTILSSNLPPNPMEIFMPASEGAINVLWKRPVTIDFSKIASWEITLVRLDTDSSTEIPATQETKTISKNSFVDRLDNLLNGEMYKITIKTVDTKGRKSDGITRNVVPQFSSAPKDPESITSIETELVEGFVVFDFSWSDGADEYDPTIPYSYNIYVTVDGQQESLPIKVRIGETTERIEVYTFDRVTRFAIPQNTLVTFRFTSITRNGIESAGNYLRSITTSFGQPLPVGNLLSEFDPESGKITVTWNNQPDASDINVQVIDDNLGDEYPAGEIIDQSVGLADQFIFDASLNHTYTITVTPSDADGVEGPSDVTVEITLLSGGFPPPALPSEISPQAGDRQIAFSWSNSPSIAVVSYKIYKKVGRITTTATDWTLLDTVPKATNDFTDFGLENDQIYSYYITSVDLHGQESLDLTTGAINLNFFEVTPKPSGILTEPSNIQLTLVGNDVLITWESLLEEFDSFTVYRSIGNLHRWASLVSLDRNTTSYTDLDLELIDGTIFYYAVGKTINDADITVQISNVAPESSILLGSITLGTSTFSTPDVSDRRDIKDLVDPIGEYTDTRVLAHKHRELDRFDPERIDLNPELIITDWETIDGRIFTTQEIDISGTSHVVKIDGRFPSVLFEIDVTTRRLIFTEPIVTVDDFGNVTGDVPAIEVRVLGIEEVQEVLDAFRFDNIHARQVGFGRINKEQMPSINHEGRIREQLLPKTYLLERFSNHAFIVPQGNVDNTKTFGNGTAFYATIESDGLLEEVIDWDQEDNGDLVGFQLPSFASDTILNLKQNVITSTTELATDEANELKLEDNQLFAMTRGLSGVASSRILFTVDATAPASVSAVGAVERSIEDMTFDSDRNRLLLLERVVTNRAIIYSPDLITGELEEETGKVAPGRGTFGFVPADPDFPSFFSLSSMEYNHNNGILYAVYGNSQKLIIIDLDDKDPITSEVAITIIGIDPLVTGKFVFAMAMDTTNNIMYGATVRGANQLYTINLSTGVATVVSGSSLSADFTSMTYDKKADKLYAVDGFVGSDAELFEINRTTGIDTSLGVFTPPSANCHAIAAKPPDESFWLVENFIKDDSLRLTYSPGVLSDVYLRFSVGVDLEAVLSSASLILTALDTDYSVGDIDLRISVLDPAAISDALTLSTESLKTVGTIASITLSPPELANDEELEIDVLTLMQTFIDATGFVKDRHVIFKIETLSTTILDSLRAFHSVEESTKGPQLDIAYVIDSAQVTDEEFFQSEKSYAFAFEFDDSAPTRWVRVATTNTPIKPNPVIDLKKRLKFKMLTKDISVYVSLGIREITSEDDVVGSDGGIVGPVEWVGATETVTDSDGNIAPIGKLVNPSSDWQEIEFDLENENVIAYSSDANSILEGKLGVLEHFAFTIVPKQTTPAGPIYIFIDKLEQIDDTIAAGTSQGILISRDFGTSWSPVRLVETPVHKFYRATNNEFIWAVATNAVLISVDPANWFETSGLTGVQYIRDIAEDEFGNMFVSTDKGVFWFEISLINNFSSWRQTQPVTAFTTDCYGMYHNVVSSGIDEIWVSTEIGIFKTVDLGQTWTDTGMNTQNLPAYEFTNISSDSLIPNIMAITRKHVLRKLGSETDFSILANFEVQHNVFDIWTMEFFANHLYVSTGKGVFWNDLDELSTSGITSTTFTKIFPGLNVKGQTSIAFGLDAVIVQDSSQLFIGQENRIMMADELNVLSIKEQFPNKELPSFFADDVEITSGYIYNAFNNVLTFREPQPVNTIYTAAKLPRKFYIPVNKGWAQTNPSTDVFLYVNGIPTWIDFELDEASILSELQVLQGKLSPIQGTLTTFNSLVPTADTTLGLVLADITNMFEGGTDGVSLINNETIIKFVEDHTRFLSLITTSVVNANDLDVFPKFKLAGFPASSRDPGSRAEALEEKEEFTANDSTGINIDTFTGEIDFLTAFSTTIDLFERQQYVFTKHDDLSITIFKSNVSNTGEFSHRELEDQMESFNTGLSSHLTRANYANLIKAGIFLETNHNFLFDRFNVTNVQSKYNSAHTNAWYDILNSTVDYDSVVKVENEAESRFANNVTVFTENTYLEDKVWVATDNDILQYTLNTTTGVLALEDAVRPGNGSSSLFVWDIFVLNEDDIYVIAEEKDVKIGHIFRTTTAGSTWEDLETINLPQKLYTFSILNGNKIVGTENGIFYSDNSFGTWFPSILTLSNRLSDTSPSVDAFALRFLNIDSTTFLIAESQRWFYTSNAGIEWFGLGGQASSNSLSVINKIARYKNLTWIGTDRGLYNDGNSILSDGIQFGLQTGLESSSTASSNLKVNDIIAGTDALYCAAGQKIYRLLNNVWKSHTVPDVSAIHKIAIHEATSKRWLVVVAHNIIATVDVTLDTGVFG